MDCFSPSALPRTTPDPEPSQPSPSRCTECSPEPTAAAEPEPAAITEPTPVKVTEPLIAPEPELNATDQVCEPATPCVVGIIVEIEGMENNPAHTSTTEGELLLDSELLDSLSEEDFWLLPFPLLPPTSPWSPEPLLVPSSSPEPLLVPSSSPEPLLVPPSTPSSASSSMSRRFPPSLPLPPPLYQPASPSALSQLPQEGPSAHPQHAMSGGSVALRDFLSPSSSGLEDPQSPPLAFETRTPPRPSDPSAPPWLLAPSSPPWPVIPPAPPGSLVPPAPPWSVVPLPSPQDSTLPALPHPSVPLAPSGSSLPPATPSSSVTLAPPRHSGSPPPPHSPEPPAPPRPSGSSVSPRLCGSYSTGLLLHRRHLRQSAPWCRRSHLHHGSSRRRLHRGPPSWLASGPPPGCSGLLPGSSHPPLPLGLIFLTLFVSAPFPLPAPLLLHAHLLNPHPPSSVGLCFSARGRAIPGGGELSRSWSVLV